MSDTAPQYTYRQSIATKPWTFRIENDQLVWEKQDQEKPIAVHMGNIAKVRPVFDPTRVQLNRYVLNITTRKGKQIKLASMSYKGISDFEDLAPSYAAFVRALHEQMARINPSIQYVRGISKLGYAMSMLVMVFLIALLGVAGFLLINGVTHPIVWVKLALLLYFTPMLYKYLKRNKPGVYDPAHVPEDLIPQGVISQPN